MDAGTSKRLDEDQIAILANRPSVEFDDVKLQADYTARATLSFYRFRQLGGSRMNSGRLRLGRLQERGIHYVSDHPTVRIFQLSGIALLVLFESAANAYFFAQQSEFGLTGGLFQAVAVSLANVAVSFFIIGYWGLRHASTPMEWRWAPWKWDRRNYIKVFGILAVIFGVLLALLVNLSAAHYRNLIDLAAGGHTVPTFSELAAAGGEEEGALPWFRFYGLVSEDSCRAILDSEIGQSIGGAATNAMCRPFALHSLDAMVLFALGASISALAAFEGRGADASFPGLSNAARHLERTREDLQYALEDYYEAIDDRVAEAKAIIAGRPLDDEEEEDANGEGDAAPVGEGHFEMSMEDELKLREALRVRVLPFHTLLSSDPSVLRDEFGVDDAAIKRVTGLDCDVPMRDDETDRENA
ncbi:MAG: hypothetical protein AAFX03_08070 [Pseudomonadota bacterium]